MHDQISSIKPIEFYVICIFKDIPKVISYLLSNITFLYNCPFGLL